MKCNMQGCPQIGSREQHAFIRKLADQCGYQFLTNAVAEASGVPRESINLHSRFGRTQASDIITWLQKKLTQVKAERHRAREND